MIDQSEPFTMLFFLIVGHALADFPLQGDYLASAKDPSSQHNATTRVWPWALGAHAMIHAGFVALITGSVVLGALEFLAHQRIDRAKCEGAIGFHQDQCLHLGCKVLWVVVAWAMGAADGI